MTRTTKIEITSPEIIKAICEMQTRFVIAWNAAEMNHGIEQTHDLPAGATYSGASPKRGAAFMLPSDTRVFIHARAPWWHWHDGWSFCRHTLNPEQVRKVVIHGSLSAFDAWLADAMAERD